MSRHLAATEEDTERLAAALAARLGPGSVVALHGDLGAGKTRFVRGLARGLGHAAEDVTSPTYVIEHRYRSTGATPLVHIDAYRLATADDLRSIGWDELLAQGEAIVAVEWAERIAAALPSKCTHVRISHCDKGREIQVDEA